MIPKALEDCKLEVGTYGALQHLSKPLLEAVQQTIELSQVTAFECHLARSLRKPLPERKASIRKYKTKYVKAKQSWVLPPLLAAAEAALLKGP